MLITADTGSDTIHQQYPISFHHFLWIKYVKNGKNCKKFLINIAIHAIHTLESQVI